MAKETVKFSLDQIPIRRALKRARKSFLLVLIVLGFIFGLVYIKFIRVPTATQLPIEQSQLNTK